MPALAPAPTSDVLTLQGVQVPASAVNPAAFFALTRRQNFLMKQIASIAGLGSNDQAVVLQTGIVSAIRVRVVGSVVVTAGTGSVATTYQWTYNLIKRLRFTANGQSDLISSSGWGLKLIAKTNRFPKDDRGVIRGVGGASPGTSFQQGTLSMASENWGLGQGVTAIPGAPTTYNFDLLIEVPVAYDPVTLLGAIFAQTNSTALNVSIDWGAQSDLFTLTGNATIALTASATIEGTVYTIPSYNGGIVIPKLTAFHQIVEARAPNAVSNGVNEVILAGQGVGRQLMRLGFRTFSGGVPLQMSDTNYLQVGWKFGGNTIPEQFSGGSILREWNEELYNTDIGGLQGYGVFDFSSLWAQRDSVDEGATTQLRFDYSIPNAVALTTPYTEYIQDVITAGAVAA